MTYISNDAVVEALHATRLAPVFHRLGDELLTAEELAEVERYTVLAESAEQTARAYELRRIANAQEIAVDLVDSGTAVDEAMLTGAAKRMAATDDVHLIAKSVYAEATRKARAVAFANVKDVPRIVTSRYNTIAAELDQIGPKLANVKTAQQAIESGKTEEWQRVSELQETYKALSRFITELRSRGLIPKARLQGQEGAHWNFVLPVNTFDFQNAARANDDGRAFFLLNMKREPWVPDSEYEAELVRVSWDKGDIEEVTAA